MYTLKNDVEICLIIKKSKFIIKTFRVYTFKEVDIILKKVREKYSDATHICYGYILENTSKACDDGEPSGSAGIPILTVLEKNNLVLVLCVVIRYFGGVKLGIGGLFRAYSLCVKEAVKEGSIVSLEKGKEIVLIFSYENHKKIDILLQNCEIKHRQFLDFITYKIHIKNNSYKDIYKELEKFSKISIIKEIYIISDI